ncbi:hypothetical protein Dimus_020052 [Dionaea muscipula]
MSGLLKEALKSLCGFHHWCYAVFWKFGHQNPGLLIWEEFHVEHLPCSVLPWSPGPADVGSVGRALDAIEGYWVSPGDCSFQVGAGVGKGVQLLINKMMEANQVHVLGEGLVGRTAFSGKHRWIVSQSYVEDVEQIEVLNEVQLQFSSGIQTIAVIPVLPYGVVQFGSSLTVLENIAFVQEVKSIILQLGCVPGALLSGSCISNEFLKDIGLPVPYAKPLSLGDYGNSEKMSAVPLVSNCSNMQISLLETAETATSSSEALGSQTLNKTLTTSLVGFGNLTQDSSKSDLVQCQTKQIESNLSHQEYLKNKVVGSKEIQLSPDVLLSHLSFSCNPGSGSYQGQSGGNNRNSMSGSDQVILGAGTREAMSQNLSVLSSFVESQINANGSQYLSTADVDNLLPAVCKPSNNLSGQLGASPYGINYSSFMEMGGTTCRGVNSSAEELIDLRGGVEHSFANSMVSDGFNNGHYSSLERQNSGSVTRKGQENHLFEAVNMASRSSSPSIPGPFDFLGGSHARLCKDLFDIVYADSSSGNYVSDILEVNFKDKLTNVNKMSVGSGVSLHLIKDVPTSRNTEASGPDFYHNCDNIPDTGIFSGSGSDHLLDAVVSGINCSVRQTSDDNISSKSTLTKISNSVPSVTFCPGSITRHIQEPLLAPSKSIVESMETGKANVKPVCGKIEAGNCSETSSLYGSNISSWIEQGSCVKHNTCIGSATSKNDDVGKSNRKRLKPGENPRPRPKDRQMIQDRMKELREIVPNGAKCSIDALLERTIKHMLFLQSVTKHADKLKQMVESKMINEDGELLLKGNSEGGATWAYEVGSHSMVCPIIVEDLNPPRQLLVEMMCEERGFFLEIADVIRGLGLTILRGVLETLNDKIWARFAVEANRDVTRMEIFIPLVRLLEQTVKANVLSVNNRADDDGKADHPS